MFETARAHSAGCRALRTKTRTTMSTEDGLIPSGRPSPDVMSHTEAWIEPTGGDTYSSLC